MKLRYPKRGFRKRRFNNGITFDSIRLSRIVEWIEMGHISAHEPITIKVMFESGLITKCKHGVKVLGSGGHRLQQLGVPIYLEVSDASVSSIEAIKKTGGDLVVNYRTPLVMRNYLRPHLFPEWQTLKVPMPSPKMVKKLEHLKSKGLDVSYPRAPWFTDRQDALEAERIEKQRKFDEAEHAALLPQYPADRSKGVSDGKAVVQRKQLKRTIKFS